MNVDCISIQRDTTLNSEGSGMVVSLQTNSEISYQTMNLNIIFLNLFKNKS